MSVKYDKVLFVDRDGVINKDPGGWTEHSYVTGWGQFLFLPGVLGALKRLAANGYKVIIVSNQAGVGKGYFRDEDLRELDRRMVEEVRKGGGDIEASYYCTHTAEEECVCRKPKTGLFENAMKRYRINRRSTYFVGDTERDMAAGKDAGLKTILVLSGKSTRKDAEGWSAKPTVICQDLAAAADFLLGKERENVREARRT